MYCAKYNFLFLKAISTSILGGVTKTSVTPYRVQPPECWSNFKCDFRKDSLTSGFAVTFVIKSPIAQSFPGGSY